MKEKILNILKSIKEKLNIKDEQLEKPKEILDKIISKFSKKKKGPPSKLALKIRRIFFKIFNLKTISMFIATVISLPAIAFLNYTIFQYVHFKHIEEVSEESVIKSKLGYATRTLLRELKHNKVKRKDLRQFIKELNEEDEYGNFAKHSSCDKRYKAYGESPRPGNIVITKETRYEFKLMAYNCKVEPIACDTIKLKPPAKSKKSHTKKAKPDDHKTTKHANNENNEHKKVNAPSEEPLGHHKKEEHDAPETHDKKHDTHNSNKKEEHDAPETHDKKHDTHDTHKKEKHDAPETHDKKQDTHDTHKKEKPHSQSHH